MTPRRHVFRFRIILVVLLSCLVPTLLLGWLAYLGGRHQVHESTATLLQSMAFSSSHQVRLWLDEQRATAVAIARSGDLLQHWNERNQNPPESDQHFLALCRLYRVIELCDQSSRWFTEVRLASIEGTVFLSDNGQSQKGPLVPPESGANLKEVLRSGEALYTQVYDAAQLAPEHMDSDDLSTGFPTLFLLAPIRGEGATVGLLGCRLAIADVAKLFPTEASNVPLDVYLIKSDGTLISSKRHVERRAFRDQLPHPTHGNSFPGSGLCLSPYLDHSGESVVGAWEPVPGTDLVVLVQTHSEVLEGPLRAAVRMLFALSLGLSMLVASLGYLTAERLLRPLRLLTRAAHELAEGHRNVRVRLRRDDEIGDLGDTFDRMVATQEASMRALQIARDEALEAYRAKTRFMANMTHELRTPLNVIIGYSEMLIGEIGDLKSHPQWVEDLEVIRRSGRDLLGLINSILDLSKVEAGKMTLDLDQFQLAELMDEVGRFAIPLVKEKGNRFRLIEGPSVEIRQDRTKIKQVLINLLGNASKFTENGEVSLGSRLEGNWLYLWVTDTGIGMTEEQCSRIFEEFRQADDSTTRKYGGTGLGLSIVQRFSELLKGRIEVTSQPGEGSTFTLVIPSTLA